MFNFRIIEYGSCDYQEMVALRDEVLRKPLGLTFSAAYLQQEINDILIGCYQEAQMLAGCCILTPVSENTVQLRQMAVAPALQGQGIGRQIIEFAEQQALRQSFSILTMHARDEATGFYRKLGYDIVGEPFIEVGIRHYEMRKKLQ